MPTNATIKVHLMHADPLIRAGVGAILSRQENMLVSCGAEAAPYCMDADVIVADYDTGLRWCEVSSGAGAGRAPRILILTPHDKEWAVRRAVQLGVSGYLLQSCEQDELLRAVRALKQGRRYLSETVAACVADSLNRIELTGRETDVLNLLAKGYCNKSIARELDIGVGTVKSHLRGLMGKLNATARTHAVVLASERGLIG